MTKCLFDCMSILLSYVAHGSPDRSTTMTLLVVLWVPWEPHRIKSWICACIVYWFCYVSRFSLLSLLLHYLFNACFIYWGKIKSIIQLIDASGSNIQLFLVMKENKKCFCQKLQKCFGFCWWIKCWYGIHENWLGQIDLAEHKKSKIGLI